ncbi:MAG: hypothetical protein ACWA5X_00060 [bacterium]
MSNIGKALEKIVNPESEALQRTDSRVDNTSRQRRFEYEDGVITRGVEASYQIQRMRQPFVFTPKELDERHFILQGDTNQSVLLQLRELRNNITMRNQTLGATILVTSVARDPESSVIARNLSAILASDDTRTSLLIESEETNAYLYGDEYKDKQVSGISDYAVSDELSVEDIILPTGIPRMRVIPFGSGQGVQHFDYFRSTRMRVLVKDVTRRYPRERFTVIDAPSVDEVPDVVLLNEYADYILLTVPYGEVTDRDVEEAVLALDQEKLLGVMMTGAPRVPKMFGKVAGRN